MQLKPNTTLQGGRYRIVDAIGNGGFGITYIAEQTLAGRNVCIKEFFPKEFYNRDEDSSHVSLGSLGSAENMDAYKAKFMKEAKTIARLDHPNIIHIHDVFEENNTAYYVMEFIAGESLNDIVKRRGALPEAEAIGYIREVAAALEHIHDQSIMHLDIKPANIMIRKRDNRAILIDFGLSKQYDTAGNQTSSTPVGISAGYAPMEQYQQGGVNEFSPETDIYSLGATFYYLVTGKVPPQAATIVDEGLPVLPASLSMAVCNTIERAMEIQRRRRPHSIKEFLALLDDNNISAPTPGVAAAAPTPAFVAPQAAPSVPSNEDEATVINSQSTPPTPTPAASEPQQPKPEPQVYQQPKPAPKQTQQTASKPKSKRSGLLWVIIGLLLLGGGGYLIYDATTSDHSEEYNREPETMTELCEAMYKAAKNMDAERFMRYWHSLERKGKTASDNGDEATLNEFYEWYENNPDKARVIDEYYECLQNGYYNEYGGYYDDYDYYDDYGYYDDYEYYDDYGYEVVKEAAW